MEPEIAMHAVIDTLHTYFVKLLNFLHTYLDKLLNSPHHLMVYIAAAAVLLVSIPLARAIFGSRSRRERDDDDVPVRSASPSMLGLNSVATDYEDDPVERRYSQPFNAMPSNVTAINGSLTVECIHCGVTMPSRQDFCPACGYAQPVKQSITAAFPA
jgi:hypothetical protein